VQKIKIRLPATLTHFGPSLDTLGLAVGIYTNIEISSRSDNQLVVEAEGKNAKHYPLAVRHPVVRGASRMFQYFENTQLGLHIRVKNDIPIGCGLNAETSFLIAGMIGANYLMGNKYTRDELIPLIAEFAPHTDSAIAAFLGGLVTSIKDNEDISYQALPITPFRLIIAVPDIRRFNVEDSPELIALSDMRANLRRTTILQQAFALGDLNLLAKALNDPIDQPLIRAGNPDYTHITEIARREGALAITTTGRDSTMVIIADKNLPHIEHAVQKAFDNLNTQADVITVPIDTQGVVISIMQSA